jgi:hypothetical protein
MTQSSPFLTQLRRWQGALVEPGDHDVADSAMVPSPNRTP